MLLKKTKESNPISKDESKEKNRGRSEIRKVEVFDDMEGIDTEKWKWVRAIIFVERIVERNWITSREESYYISSLSSNIMSAKEFNLWIRSHWWIENSLHYAKDVTFKEDSSKIISKNAPKNKSLMINIVMNVFHKNGYTNMAKASRLVANNIPMMLWFLLE